LPALRARGEAPLDPLSRRRAGTGWTEEPLATSSVYLVTSPTVMPWRVVPGAGGHGSRRGVASGLANALSGQPFLQPSAGFWVNRKQEHPAMRKTLLGIGAILLIVSIPALSAGVAKRNALFHSKLSSEQRIIHALSRLTFGPRPGDLEKVRRAGLK